MRKVRGREELMACPLGELGVSPWIQLDQKRIDAFADATDDHSWIHVNPQRALLEMPEGSTIAHGFLCLSLLPRMLDTLIQIDEAKKAFNYGMERLRFISPVPSDSRIRLKSSLLSVAPRGGSDVSVSYDCIVEIEARTRPALAGQWLAVYFF